jgi:hypothetical protein
VYEQAGILDAARCEVPEQIMPFTQKQLRFVFDPGQELIDRPAGGQPRDRLRIARLRTLPETNPTFATRGRQKPKRSRLSGDVHARLLKRQRVDG